MLSRIASLGAGPLLVACAVLATAGAEPYRSRPYLHDNLYLPSGKFVEQSSVGYRQLAADIIWLQAVQYYGGYAKNEHGLGYFEGLIDIVTDLDPHFRFPYMFGAVVMSQDMGDLERGIGILQKGMVNNPGSWEFPFEIGFLHYVSSGNRAAAAHYFHLASRMPGGGDRARRFAAFVYSQAGHEENSIRMWEEIAENSDQPYMRDLAKHYIEKLRSAKAKEKAERHGT